MRKQILRSLALVLLVAVATACSASNKSESSNSQSMDDMHSEQHFDRQTSPIKGARVLQVAAKNFSFSPALIEVSVSEAINIDFKSEDILHDLTIDELNFHVVATKSKSSLAGVVAKEPGRYEFYCSVAGHRAAGMKGTINVTE